MSPAQTVFENDLPVGSRLVGWNDRNGCSRTEPDEARPS
jgi:hypothetical protein